MSLYLYVKRNDRWAQKLCLPTKAEIQKFNNIAIIKLYYKQNITEKAIHKLHETVKFFSVAMTKEQNLLHIPKVYTKNNNNNNNNKRKLDARLLTIDIKVRGIRLELSIKNSRDSTKRKIEAVKSFDQN